MAGRRRQPGRSSGSPSRCRSRCRGPFDLLPAIHLRTVLGDTRSGGDQAHVSWFGKTAKPQMLSVKHHLRTRRANTASRHAVPREARAARTPRAGTDSSTPPPERRPCGAQDGTDLIDLCRVPPFRPPILLRLKVETNTREHFAVYGFKERPFSISSRWFEGACSIHTYELDELLGTKFRALYQRKQGRDLFDLATALEAPGVNAERIIKVFEKYMEHAGHPVTRAVFEQNFAAKRGRP